MFHRIRPSYGMVRIKERTGQHGSIVNKARKVDIKIKSLHLGNNPAKLPGMRLLELKDLNQAVLQKG